MDHFENEKDFLRNCWVADEETYKLLQKLKPFVQFVGNLKYATQKDKQNTIEIITSIENINKPSTFTGWNVCLDITDPQIQNSTDGAEGLYWRTWSVYFQINAIEIEAVSHHTCEPLGAYDNHFYFYGNVDFRKNISYKRIFFTEDITNFIADALQYQNYITASFNEVEVDIDL